LPLPSPTDETWAIIDDWIEQAGTAGERFGVGDLLIAALAHEVGGLLWSLDRDFERMQRLGLVGLYA